MATTPMSGTETVILTLKVLASMALVGLVLWLLQKYVVV